MMIVKFISIFIVSALVTTCTKNDRPVSQDDKHVDQEVAPSSQSYLSTPIDQNLFAESPDEEPIKKSEVVTSAVVTTSDRNLICRATIAEVMGRPLKIIKVDKSENSFIYVSYIRPSDGSLWRMRCKFSGNRVIWSTLHKDEGGSSYGRWRNSYADSIITFLLEENKVTIIESYSDGSSSSTDFSRGER